VSAGADALACELLAEELPGAAAWEARAAAALTDGWRFADLHALPLPGDGARLRLTLERRGRLLVLDCRQPGSWFPSMLPHAPAAQWDEREAHDLHGIHFAGHEPLRPLIHHPPELSDWTTPVRGRDVHQVAVGPIHAGVIESGHFRFHVVGERILHLDLRLGYKHRGLERAAEGQTPAQALAFVQRACGACAVANAVAFAHALESANGLWPAPELRRARTLLAELERVYNHLGDVAAICAGVGLAAGTAAFAALKERVHRLNARLAGHRFLFGAVALGESRLAIGPLAAREAAGELREIREELARAWRQLRFSHSAQDRFSGTGVLSRADAERLGAVGPAARASGVALDVRSHSPRLAYGGFQAAAPEKADGDVAARLDVRGTELEASFALLAELLARPLQPCAAEPVSGHGGAAVGVGRVESPRGATVCVLALDEGRVARLRLRTGSYANWPALVHLVAGELLPDFPLINKSFELCYACADR